MLFFVGCFHLSGFTLIAVQFTTHDSPPLDEIGLFIFSCEKTEQGLARDEFLNMSGGQEKIKCFQHKKCSLMKEQVG